MNRQYVTVIEEGPIASLRLTNPDRRNAVGRDLIRELAQAAESLRDLTEARVVLFEADGPDFSSGADVDELGYYTEHKPLLEVRRRAEEGGRLLRALREIHQPTICVIQGMATGAGACFTTACDFRVAAESARIGYAEARMGMNLMWHALPDLIALIGPARTKRMLLSARLFPARELEAWGFIDVLCPPDALETAARNLALEYAAMPPIALQMIKRSVNRLATSMGEAMMHADFDQWLLTTRTDDFRECVTAFQERRSPVPTGN